jgi:hypothetical protein
VVHAPPRGEHVIPDWTQVPSWQAPGEQQSESAVHTLPPSVMQDAAHVKPLGPSVQTWLHESQSEHAWPVGVARPPRVRDAARDAVARAHAGRLPRCRAGRRRFRSSRSGSSRRCARAADARQTCAARRVVAAGAPAAGARVRRARVADAARAAHGAAARQRHAASSSEHGVGARVYHLERRPMATQGLPKASRSTCGSTSGSHLWGPPRERCGAPRRPFRLPATGLLPTGARGTLNPWASSTGWAGSSRAT